MRPLLLLDVDGVLALREPPHDRFVRHVVRSSAGADHEVWLDAEQGVWLRLLSELFEIVWTTGWEHDAPRLLGPLLTLPAWSVLSFSERPRLDRRFEKLPDVTARVGDRAMAWVDDDLGADALTWVAGRTAPTMTVTPSPDRGLERSQVSELIAFGTQHGSGDVRQRAVVLLVEDDCLAVIERQRDGRTYYVLPGGGLEPGETIVEAAEREAMEELSLVVETGHPVAHIRVVDGDQRAVQHVLHATRVSGEIGPGSGPEYVAPDPSRGSYHPMWLPLRDVGAVDVRPRAVVDAIVADLPAELPMIFEEIWR